MKESLENIDSFKKSYFKSLGSLFSDLYSPQDLEFLCNELSNHFQTSQNEIFYSHLYVPSSKDPLFRMQQVCLVLSFESLQFFTHRLRRILWKEKLEVNRSIHFHPIPGREFIYIEIFDMSLEELNDLVTKLPEIYNSISIAVKDFKPIRNREVPQIFEGWDTEIVDLLHWLIDQSFILESVKLIEKSNEWHWGIQEESKIENLKNLSVNDETSLIFQESPQPSLLGDRNYFYIYIVNKSKKMLISGSFNEFGRNSAILSIPYLGSKFRNAIQLDGIENFSGLGRSARMMINSIPTEIAFLLPETSYSNVLKGMLEQSLRNSLRSVAIGLSETQFIIITFIPEKNWSESKWKQSDQRIKDLDHSASITSDHVLRNGFIIGFHYFRAKQLTKQQLFDLSSRMEFFFRTWEEEFKHKWEENGRNISEIGDISFHEDYKSTHSPEKSVHDVLSIISLDQDHLKVEVIERENVTLVQSITTKNRFLLSDWVKVMNSVGVRAISERVYHIKWKEIYFAKTEFFLEKIPTDHNLHIRIKSALEMSFLAKLPMDQMSELVLHTNLDTNGLYFLKSIRDYCLQGIPALNPEEFNQVILKFPSFAEEAYHYFVSKFKDGKEPDSKHLLELAESGKTLREDKILKAILGTLQSILRTNFFGTSGMPEVGIERQAVAYKIDSNKTGFLPDPKPFREIFVFSPLFQGIHLRGGRVARGGLRFSDRPTDYRTEVLGLLKTQMVKNVIIVPVGSKGCFVITKHPFQKNEIKMEEAYKGYVSSLLELTDNRFSGKIQPFQGDNKIPYAYDDADPYLVVAADKGTANLSDTANSISLSKKFWLGDAFASGGSKGYSHKAFGITAKGALVTADRNLRCLGFDFRTKSVRVVGIGDMGGDVFGNGLIESEHFELIAAFNHKHIFLDPTPDSKKSFLERKRLFFDKNSGWDCYDKSIISKGGGVFLRTEKSIPISIEVQKALDINKTKLSGAELIQSILKAPMDLLYNGGIGTYIKASWEETNRIGDPANNDVRVNGNEIRAKVVSEGGNLGCTQSSRLEMDWGGVLIFSDAIDNSAGVDLSDHEVNLKIFFQELLDSGKIKNETERDRYLEAFGPEVAKLVLEDNSYQSLSINSDRMVSSIEGWEFIKNSIHYLSSRKILDLKQNELPLNEEDWSEWQKNSPEFPRSALGIIFAHAKMDWFEFLSKENEIPMEEFRELYLGYFPKELGKKFEKELLSHPLRKEIFITTAMNLFMNFFGMKGYLILVQKENPLAIFVEILRYLRDKNLIEIFQKMSNHRNTQEELSIYQLLNVLRDQVLGQFFSGKSSQLPGLKEFSSLLPLAEKNHLSSMGIEFR